MLERRVHCVTGLFVLLAVLAARCTGQAADCYSNPFFGCSGDSTQRSNGQICCDEGFLSFRTLGEETCSQCPGNSICQASSDCSDAFPGLGTQSSAQCCSSGGGVAYINSAGDCERCTFQCDSDQAQMSCDMCISSPECVWCPSLQNDSNIVHCYNRSSNSPCSGMMVEDPQSVVNIAANEPISNQSTPRDNNLQQVQPQLVNMTLRRGAPQSFNMSFIALRNTPLDVYFLLDLSASLTTIVNALRFNLQEIANSVGDISSAYQIGIGGFVDKDVFPFGGTTNYFRRRGNTAVCPHVQGVCTLPFGFRHLLSLTNNVTAFQETLDSSVQTAINVDGPEGGLDALMQVSVCNNIIGWRPGALRMLFFITDNDYHIAGDGYLAGLIRPNDGKCHLEAIPERTGQYEYSFSTVQDYPSIYQVLRALEEQLIVPVFGVQAIPGLDNTETYERLATEFRSVQSIALPIILPTDSSNTTEVARQLIAIIENSYANTSQSIQVQMPPGIEGYRITIEPLDCPQIDENGACRVMFDDIITFRVTVELTDCYIARTQRIQLSGAPYTFSAINLEPLCNCNCSAQQEVNSPFCNGNGTLVCGICESCNEGRLGDQCECDTEILECPMFNGEPCGGAERGTCNACGVCKCLGGFFGDAQGCKCDNGSCMNNCNDNGVCECGTPPRCKCTRTGQNSEQVYFGDSCQCNPDNCWNPTYPDSLCQVPGSSATGRCGCAGCDCSFNATQTNNLEERGNLCLLNDENICSFFEPCARCQNNDGSSAGCGHAMYSACKTGANYTTIDEETVIDQMNYVTTPCIFVLDGCTYEFFLPRGDPFANPILISTDIACPGLPPWAPYVIAIVIVLAILIIGLIILTLLKLCFFFWDKVEYGKFAKELQDADFAPHENPLYLNPQQDYQNPILRRFSSKRSS